jgi:hypothetical protein
VFKRILVVITAVALVVGVLALPALAQEEEEVSEEVPALEEEEEVSEEETPSCAELIDNIQWYLTEYDAGRITIEEAAAEYAAIVEDGLADGVVCSEPELQELYRTPGAGDVGEVVAAEYGL